MSKYGYSVYGASKYGQTPKLAYSVEPMSINVLKFYEVSLNWQLPTGNFTRFRVVRNQNGYPETSEDGIIIYELNSEDGSSLEGTLTKSSFLDGTENPNQPKINAGRNIFYRVFLYTSDDVWVKAGEINDLVPENTGAITRTVNLLPRVLTSDVLSPLGVVDEASYLYRFLDGIAFTYEEFMTLIKLGRPSHNLESTNYKTIPGETLNVGLNPEPNLPVLRQRALIREAISLYANKGTALGIANYAESLTGFAPTVTVSSNLMLTVQDSTFYDSTGRWEATNATLSSTDEMVPDNEDKSIDLVYSLKIEPSDTGVMTLGADDPTTQGVPILPETDYIYSFKAKCPASGGVDFTVDYYDKDNNLIAQTSNSFAANNSWQTFDITETSPAGASYVVLTIGWDTVTDYYIDMVYVGKTPFVEYEEARAMTLELAPKLENYIKNPSFEVDDTGWVLTNITFSQDTDVPVIGYPGSYSGVFTCASGSWSIHCSNQLTVEPGTYFTISQYMKSADITSVDIYINLFDSSDNLVDTKTRTIPVSTDWERSYDTILIPSDSEATYATYTIEGTVGTLYLDMVMAQDTYLPSDYFDGSLPELTGVIWEGTANDSNSLYYPNKSIKFARLSQTLNDWVPMNTFWRITTPAGLEYTNLTV